MFAMPRRIYSIYRSLSVQINGKLDEIAVFNNCLSQPLLIQHKSIFWVDGDNNLRTNFLAIIGIENAIRRTRVVPCKRLLFLKLPRLYYHLFRYHKRRQHPNPKLPDQIISCRPAFLGEFFPRRPRPRRTNHRQEMFNILPIHADAIVSENNLAAAAMQLYINPSGKIWLYFLPPDNTVVTVLDQFADKYIWFWVKTLGK